MGEDKGNSKPLFINASEGFGLKDENDQVIVSTIQPINKEEIAIIYPIDVPSTDILTDSTGLSGVMLEAKQIEVVTETIERSKELGAGTKIAVSFAGIGKFEYEKKPQREIKTIKKAVFRNPKNRKSKGEVDKGSSHEANQHLSVRCPAQET
jgi:hypothetical protein